LGSSFALNKFVIISPKNGSPKTEDAKNLVININNITVTIEVRFILLLNLGVIFICFKKRKTNLYLNCYKKYILIYEGAKIATNVLVLGVSGRSGTSAFQPVVT
jgi:hypothetical protein